MSSEKCDSDMIVETTNEPLQQILKRAAGIDPSAEPKKNHQPKVSQTLPFRPLNRQPTAVLTVLDDCSGDEGETIRLRQSTFTIGREKGDLTFPFDHDISSQHVELRCQQKNGKYRWFLVDKGSRNGTFLRVYRASLTREMEFILGNRRYAFQLPQVAEQENSTEIVETNAYQAPTSQQIDQLHCRLSEIGATETSLKSFVLNGRELIVGRSSKCSIRISDDPFLSPKHARFYKDERDRWMISDTKSLNGVWIRIRKMALDRQAEFQIGQQRFFFRPQTT